MKYISEARMTLVTTGLTLALSIAIFNAQAADLASPSPPPDATASDPANLKWMVGSPPPADRILRFDDGSYFQFPAMRWSVSNFRQLMPTINVSRGLGDPVPLPRSPRSDIDAISFTPIGASVPMTWEQSLASNYTDGIVVLHRGSIVYERYSVR